VYGYLQSDFKSFLMMLSAQQPPAGNLLSMQEDTWGTGKTNFHADAGGYSVDSSDVDNAVSPFDDIGYLASGVGASGSIREERKIKVESTTKGTSLGNFFESSKSGDLQEVREEEPRRGRLEKSLSKSGQLSDDQSLGLSALHPHPQTEKGKGKRNWLDRSKHSLALSVLVPSKSSSKNKSKNFDISRNSLGLSALGSSKNNSKSKSKNLDLSRASFGLGSSKQTKEKKKGMITNLQAENKEHSSENERLKAQLAKTSESLERLESFREWRSFGELINVTMELCQAKSRCEQADLETIQLQSELEHYEKEFEEFNLNREKEKKSQQLRIALLEVKCLQNGIDISDISKDTSLLGEGQGKDKLVLNKPENVLQDEESITSFGQESIEDEEEKEELGGGDTLGKSLSNLLNQSDEKLLRHLEGYEEEISVSDCTKFSGDSTINSCRPTPVTRKNKPPILWAPSPFNVETFKVPAKNADNTRGVGLEEFLLEASHNKFPNLANLETDTWAPHPVVEDALGKNPEEDAPPPPAPAPAPIVQSAPAPPPPPPPPPQIVKSAPAPSGRKRNKESPGHRPERSSSNGNRSRNKDRSPPPPEESMNEPPPVDRGVRKSRSKSPGTRRKQKAIVEPDLEILAASLSNAPPGTRRKLKCATSFVAIKGDSTVPKRTPKTSLNRSNPSIGASLGKDFSHSVGHKRTSSVDSRKSLDRSNHSIGSSLFGKVFHDSAVTSDSIGIRRQSSVKNSLGRGSNHGKNSLGRGSNHSTGRRRNRASDVDRLTVSGALDKALQMDVDSGDF
jgi:hypothetical protein